MIVAAVLLVLLILGLVLLPRVWPRFAAHPHARTLAWVWAWLVVAWALNGASLFYAGHEVYAVAWALLALSMAGRGAMAVVVVWRVVAVARGPATG